MSETTAQPKAAYYYLVRTRLGEFTVYQADFGPQDLGVRLQKAQAKGVLNFTDGAVFVEDLSSIKLYPQALTREIGSEVLEQLDSWSMLSLFTGWARTQRIQLVIDLDELDPALSADEDDEDSEPAREPVAAGGRPYRAKP